MADEFERFTQLYRVTERMIEEINRDDLVKVARILAMNVANYQGKYGLLPLDETLALLNAKAPNEEQSKILADGMENLATIIAIVHGGGGDDRSDAIH